MFGIIALAFVIVPIVELWVIIEVAGAIGTLQTIALLIVVSLLGAWLVRFEGVGVWRRLQQTVAAGRMPGNELMDGALILFGGALLLTPGFVTDATGLLLLFPPSRTAVRSLLARRVRRRVNTVADVRVIREEWPGQGPE